MKYLTLAESAVEVLLVFLVDRNALRLHGILGSGVVYPWPEVFLQVKGNDDFGADLMLAEPCVTPLVSQTLLQRLEEEEIELGQTIPVHDDRFRGYSLVNPIGLVDLINENESSWFTVNGIRMYDKVVLQRYRGADAIFRLRG